MNKCLNDNEVESILDFRCPRYNELPSIFLYKDQVILYIEEVLSPLIINPNEKLITPTMLNNYVKQKIVSPPHNKRYDARHIAYLIVVCLLKQIYTLSDICDLIKIQIESFPIEEAYDFFCVELEAALRFAFSDDKVMELSSAKKFSVESELVRSCVIALSHKLFILKYLSIQK